MNGYYQLIVGQDGAFVFVLRSGNHERLLTSRLYWTRQAALDAAAALRVLSQRPGQYLRLDGLPTDGDDDGDGHRGATRHWSFQVLDEHRQLLGAGETYNSRAGREAAIAAVQRNAPAPRFRGLSTRPTVADLAARPVSPGGPPPETAPSGN